MAENPAPPSPAEKLPPDQKVNILLVDDEPANLLALEALLADLGQNLIKAQSGEAALRLVLKQDFAAVLLDVQMQGLDGFETAKLIRGRDRSRHTPIIFITGHEVSRLTLEQAYLLGAVDYLVKPLVPVILKAKVAGFVELFQKTEQVRRQAEQLRQVERREFEGKLADENRRLQDQWEWLRVTLASIGDAVIATDPQGAVTFLNRVAQSLTGWSQEEAVGRPLESVFPVIDEATRMPVEHPVAKVIRAGTVVGLGNHTVLLARDGTEKPIDNSAAPIRTSEGRTLGVVLIFRDVTEPRRAQKAVLDSEARKAAILQTALDCIITIDHQGNVIEFNPAAERTFGYRRADVLGRQMADLIIPLSLRERHCRGLARYLATGEGPVLGQRIEMPALRADGTEFPVELAIMRIPTGGPPLFTAYLRDITRRKRAEDRRNARLAVSQVLAEAATVREAAPHILEAVCKGLGWDVGVLWTLDRPAGVLRWLELWHTPSVHIEEFESATRRQAFMTGVGLPGRVWSGGKSAWIPDVTQDANFPRASAASKEGLHGAFACPILLGTEFLGVLEFFHQEVRPPDADLLEMMSTVGGQVGQFMERRRAEQSLKEADRLKDEFLAMLAHELRNPLAPIRNALYVLRHPGTDATTAQEMRDMAERQVRHMARLLDDLLDVSRISRGRIELRREAVDVAGLVGRTLEAVRPLIDEGRHQLTVSLPPEPVRVDADPTRLEQVLTNLLNNAAKYTEPGGHIRLVVERQGGDVVLRVRDTGVGIAADMLPRIFDLFVQGDRRPDRARAGVGIGLTLVRRLVELHGGTVDASSPGPGQGSEFLVRLPAAAGAPVGEEGRPAADAGVPAAGPPRRVLVVDDNADVAESLALLLKLAGHDARAAYDGQTALSLAQDFRPQIVFLDIGMPGMDGYEVCRRLRQQPGTEKALIVALTGWGQEKDRRLSRQAGFDHHLVKPVEPEALQALLAGGAAASPVP